jgi:hypothetical protein
MYAWQQSSQTLHPFFGLHWLGTGVGGVGGGVGGAGVGGQLAVTQASQFAGVMYGWQQSSQTLQPMVLLHW